VADRVRADPGSREYGSLSVLVRMFYSVARLFDISPGCFSPRPKVTSTVLKMIPESKLSPDTVLNHFKQFLYDCFAQKRKTLVNSLSASGGYEKATIEKSLVSLGKNSDIRAEQLSGREFEILYGKIAGND
jgi:16S rRNA (adenine1518-N6/adenine1519-N6)-dimethyltransferase